MKTVATAPRAIFFLTVAATLSSFILVGLVRLPTNDLEDEMDDLEGHAETLDSVPTGEHNSPTVNMHPPAIVVIETTP
jgi:hypothetical protein